MREKPATSAGPTHGGSLMKFTRKAQLALTAVAAAAPLALALPAQASTTSSLCTVTPWAPSFDHIDSSGQKVINYGTTVYCQSGRSIEIQDQRWDDDTYDLIPSADDPHGITTYTITFTSTSTVYESAAKALPDSDAWGDDNEEMYHSVRFRVTSNGVTSPWTAWEDSTVVSFHL
jgi:hypothetical protein